MLGAKDDIKNKGLRQIEEEEPEGVNSNSVGKEDYN